MCWVQSKTRRATEILRVRFKKERASFEKMLDRHLSDEEELIVPVILKTGSGGLE
jgi:hypothetical protein